jgi:catechol 2,3-dioxygenase-like lactoylglutathione lyase family enzyme
MTGPNPIRVTLLVLYTSQLEECRAFYAGLGLDFVAEQHGQGPRHHAAVLADGTVLELYPARPGRLTGALRLGLAVDGAAADPPLDAGHHQLIDPDGRVVEIHALRRSAVHQQPITVVTGGSRGIGAAICARLSADGHDIVLGYRADAAAAEAVASTVREAGRTGGSRAHSPRGRGASRPRRRRRGARWGR